MQTTDNRPTLMTYADVLARGGFSERTLRNRIAAERVMIYQAPHDRRVRLLDARDVERILQPKPVKTVVGSTA